MCNKYSLPIQQTRLQQRRISLLQARPNQELQKAPSFDTTQLQSAEMEPNTM